MLLQFIYNTSILVDLFCSIAPPASFIYRLPSFIFVGGSQRIAEVTSVTDQRETRDLKSVTFICECWRKPRSCQFSLLLLFPFRYWEFGLLLSKPCGWLIIKTLEAASSLTDRNAIQGQSRLTLSDLTYTIDSGKALSNQFLYIFWIGSKTQGQWIEWSIYLFIRTEIQEHYFSSFLF